MALSLQSLALLWLCYHNVEVTLGSGKEPVITLIQTLEITLKPQIATIFEALLNETLQANHSTISTCSSLQMHWQGLWPGLGGV